MTGSEHLAEYLSLALFLSLSLMAHVSYMIVTTDPSGRRIEAYSRDVLAFGVLVTRTWRSEALTLTSEWNALRCTAR